MLGPFITANTLDPTRGMLLTSFPRQTPPGLHRGNRQTGNARFTRPWSCVYAASSMCECYPSFMNRHINRLGLSIGFKSICPKALDFRTTSTHQFVNGVGSPFPPATKLLFPPAVSTSETSTNVGQSHHRQGLSPSSSRQAKSGIRNRQ